MLSSPLVYTLHSESGKLCHSDTEGQIIVVCPPAIQLTKAQDILNPDWGGKRKWAHHKYKKKVAMTDCFQAECSITRQSVVAIFFLYLWCAMLGIFSLQSRLSISSALDWNHMTLICSLLFLFFFFILHSNWSLFWVFGMMTVDISYMQLFWSRFKQEGKIILWMKRLNDNKWHNYVCSAHSRL